MEAMVSGVGAFSGGHRQASDANRIKKSIGAPERPH